VNYKTQIIATPKPIGQIITIAGPEGSGKTTLLKDAPRRLFVPTETGGSIANAMPLIETWEGINALIDDITTDAQKGQFRYSAISWDSVTAMERLLFDWTVRTDPAYKNKPGLNMATAHGGYGKSYGVAFEEFTRFINKCDILARYGGVHHIFACHTFVDRVIDTEAGEYDRQLLQLYSPRNGKSYGQRELIMQRSDLVGIIYDPIVISKGDKAVLATSLNRGRMLAVDASPAFAAKNRFNINAPISIPKEGGWNSIAKAIYDNCGIDVYNRGV